MSKTVTTVITFSYCDREKPSQKYTSRFVIGPNVSPGLEDLNDDALGVQGWHPSVLSLVEDDSLFSAILLALAHPRPQGDAVAVDGIRTVSLGMLSRPSE